MRSSLSTDKVSYARGKSVNVTYRVTNNTPSTQHFEFADSCEFQLLVKKPDGADVYTNIGVCFFNNLGYDLASEESKTYTHAWQLDETIESGRYVLEGSLRGGPGEEFGSTVQAAEVTIED